MHHMFFQKTQKTLTIGRPLNNVICNDAIKSDGRNNGVSHAMYKAPPDTATNPSHWLPILAGGYLFIFCGFINEYEHIQIWRFYSDVVHIKCTHHLILLHGRRGNNLSSNWKLLKCSRKCRKHSIFVMLSPKLILKFIKINGSLMPYDGRDKCNVQWGEYLRASSSTRVFAWVCYSSISWIQRKCFINKWLLDTKYVTDLLDSMVIVIQEGDLGFDVGRYNAVAPRHGWLWRAKPTTLIQLQATWVSYARSPCPAVSEAQLLKFCFSHTFGHCCKYFPNAKSGSASDVWSCNTNEHTIQLDRSVIIEGDMECHLL